MLKSKLRLASSMMMLACAAVCGCGLITDESRIKVARIGNEAITRGDLDAYLQQLPIEERYRTKSKQAKLEKLEQMVTRELLLKEADKRGIQVTDEEIDSEMQRRGVQDISPEALGDYGPVEGDGHDHEHGLQNVREQLALEIRLTKLQRQAVPAGLTVSDEEVKQYYEANKGFFVMPEMVRMRYVTCQTMEEAQKVLDRTGAGEDFAEIVRKVADESEGKRGQELPPIPLTNVGPQELNAAISEASPGDVVGPFKREQGYDIVQLVDRRASGTAPLDQIKGAVMQYASRDKALRAYEQFLADLKESYQVKIFAENLAEDMPF